MKKMYEIVYRCCFCGFIYSVAVVICGLLYAASEKLSAIVTMIAFALGAIWLIMWTVRTIRRHLARKAGSNGAGSVSGEIETDAR